MGSARACAINTVRVIDVHMKMIADQVVSRVSTLAAARGPKAVCEPCPPKAPARSAERPCCKQNHDNQKDAHNHVHNDDEIEKNLHS